MELIRKFGPVKIEELWFAAGSIKSKSDLVHLFQSPIIPPLTGVQTSVAFQTLHIDLKQTEAHIFANIAPVFRNEIRRALANASIEYFPCDRIDTPAFDSFVLAYLKFCSLKNIQPINLKRLYNLQDSGMLLCSSVQVGGKTSIWHMHIQSGNRGRLLLSVSLDDDQASLDRASLGRSNKALHWLDIKYFKSRGFELYDFGGYAGAHPDHPLYGVDKFKKSFGGQKVVEFNIVVARTLMGRLIFRLTIWRDYVKSWSIKYLFPKIDSQA